MEHGVIHKTHEVWATGEYHLWCHGCHKEHGLAGVSKEQFIRILLEWGWQTVDNKWTCPKCVKRGVANAKSRIDT